MCNWVKCFGDSKWIGKNFQQKCENIFQFTLLLVNHVLWVKSIGTNESQLESTKVNWNLYKSIGNNKKCWKIHLRNLLITWFYLPMHKVEKVWYTIGIAKQHWMQHSIFSFRKKPIRFSLYTHWTKIRQIMQQIMCMGEVAQLPQRHKTQIISPISADFFVLL